MVQWDAEEEFRDEEAVGEGVNCRRKKFCGFDRGWLGSHMYSLKVRWAGKLR